MKRTICVLVAVALGMMSAPAGTAHRQADSLLQLLPPALALEGWTRSEPARIYVGDELYAFIDGGADLFLEYGFRRSLAAEYQNAAGRSITLEIYEMTDPGAAFGVYSIRSGEKSHPVEIGQEGCERPYYVMFWKGPFYISIAGSDSTEQCRSGLKSLARAVDATIPVRGAKPYPVDLLPPGNLEKERYVRGYLGMSSTLVFGIEELFPVMDGVIGSYRNHVLVFMRYGSPALALHRLERVLAAFRMSKRSKRAGSRNSVACFTYGKNQTLCCAQAGNYLVLSLSSVDSVADDSCRKAMLWLRQHS